MNMSADQANSAQVPPSIVVEDVHLDGEEGNMLCFFLIYTFSL